MRSFQRSDEAPKEMTSRHCKTQRPATRLTSTIPVAKTSLKRPGRRAETDRAALILQRVNRLSCKTIKRGELVFIQRQDAEQIQFRVTSSEEGSTRNAYDARKTNKPSTG